MSDWRQALNTIAADAEAHFDHLKKQLDVRLQHNAPLRIVPFLGHGTPDNLYLTGRVLTDRGLTEPADNDTFWDNLLNTYRRFNTDEVPYAQVQARFHDTGQTVTANDEGYFRIALSPDTPVQPGWREIHLHLLAAPRREMSAPVEAVGRVFVPPPAAQFGVISDIDDTVLQTDVRHLLRFARNVFLRNARTRLPFPGVAAFYRALQGATPNPLFYLSSSPWNLYDLLIDFFDVRGIPIGPLYLVDMGLTRDQFLTPGHARHKLARIRNLLATHPHLPFILIGDSGQHDPEIYVTAAEEHVGRIRAIYIRDVTGASRDAEIRAMIDRASVAGAAMLLVPDTVAAAEHAAAQGYIAPGSLEVIRAESALDTSDEQPFEQYLD